MRYGFTAARQSPTTGLRHTWLTLPGVGPTIYLPPDNHPASQPLDHQPSTTPNNQPPGPAHPCALRLKNTDYHPSITNRCFPPVPPSILLHPPFAPHELANTVGIRNRGALSTRLAAGSVRRCGVGSGPTVAAFQAPFQTGETKNQ